jgi:cysteine desulfurase
MVSFGKRRIYLDYASATEPLKEALAAMRKAEKLIGNPGAIHAEAVAAKDALEAARAKVAHELACKPREVVFTSGLTESINLAILGFARKLLKSDPHKNSLKGTHWVVSSIEHSAVLESFSEIERLGGDVTHIDPDERGIIAPEVVLRAINPETVFLSIGWANNETGAVQSLRDIARAVKGKNERVVLHSDAGQAPLYLAPQVHTLGVDMMSFGSNKLYGPHGVGALYAATTTALAPLVLGGGQERGLRSGTENVALAVGFAQAFASVSRERNDEAKRLRALRDDFASALKEKISDAVLNTDLKRSLPHILNISIPGVNSEYITLALDRVGIALSTKSACGEGENKKSHVVEALPGESWRAENTLRFSLGRATRARDMNRTVMQLVSTVAKSRTW